jgi:hypothetical protein
MYLGPDRRERRSANIVTALKFLLDSVAERFGLLSLVLTDDEGLLVAGSSPLVDPEELAAHAPLVARNVIQPEVEGWPLSVWPVETGSGPLTFCAIGEDRIIGAATLMANRGIRRILG